MTDLIQLGSEIGQKRNLLKFSQSELATKAHISRATLDALENHRTREIGFSKLSRVLAALGLELSLHEATSRRPTLDELTQEDRDDQSLDRRS